MFRGPLACSLTLLAAACSSEEDPADAAEPAARASEPSPAPAPAVVHRYTRLDDCRLLRSAPEEATFYEYECLGEGGYRLRKVQSDLRDNLVVLAPDGSEHKLDLPALASGAFSELGDTAEWRGTETARVFAPHALIVRQSVVQDPDPAVPERSYLLAIRLTPRPCVVARLEPGPAQNERAREVAERPGPCLPEPA